MSDINITAPAPIVLNISNARGPSGNLRIFTGPTDEPNVENPVINDLYFKIGTGEE